MNLFLTQALVPFQIAARWRKDRGFADSYAWHKRTWECFPNQAEGRQFLTRLDSTQNGFRLLLLSKTPPEKPDWCPDSLWQTKPVHPAYLTYPSYRFSLLANPTIKPAVPRNAEGKRRGAKRLALTSRPDLLAWLERKGLQHGFSIQREAITTNAKPSEPFLIKNNHGYHSATEFSGILTVTDSNLFASAFQNGIGTSKAFGFGMLCLSPVSSQP